MQSEPEDNICYFVLRLSSLHFGDTIQRCKNLLYNYILKGHNRENRTVIWRSSLIPGEPREVPDYARFKTLFPPADKDKPALPLHNPGAADSSIETKWPLPDFLACPLEGIEFSREKLDQADELLYAAYDARYSDQMLQKTYKALRCSPYCTDAYSLLAAKSEHFDEKIALYRRAVRAGELSLGELFFKETKATSGVLSRAGLHAGPTRTC